MQHPMAHIAPQFVDTHDLSHDEFVSSFPGGPAEAVSHLLADQPQPATLRDIITWPSRWLDRAMRQFALNTWRKIL